MYGTWNLSMGKISNIKAAKDYIYIFAGRVCFVICSENGVFKYNY